MRYLYNVVLMFLIIVFLAGCSTMMNTLGDRRVAAGCQVADGLTTYYALTHGAVELNPFLSGASPGAILLIKLAFAFITWKALPPIEEATKGDKFLGTTITVLGCVPAINNLNVIKGLP